MCSAHPATGAPPACPHRVPFVCFRAPSLLPLEKGGISVGLSPQARGQWSRPSCFTGGLGTSEHSPDMELGLFLLLHKWLQRWPETQKG